MKDADDISEDTILNVDSAYHQLISANAPVPNLFCIASQRQQEALVRR